MALALSLPALDARPANPPETRPARVQPWLEETLKRDPIDAAGVIGDALAATNRVAVSETRRLELAERYYGTALTLWPNLERHFSRGPHPLSGNALAAAKAALTLSTELATAYKHLLSHEAEKRMLLSGNRLLYQDGVPIALYAASEVQFLEALAPKDEWEARNALLRRHVPAALEPLEDSSG